MIASGPSASHRPETAPARSIPSTASPGVRNARASAAAAAVQSAKRSPSGAASAARGGDELGAAGADPERRLEHASELVGVGVHMDQRLARTRRLDHRVAAGRRLIQARADHQQQIGLPHARGEPRIDPQAERAAVHRRVVVDVVLAAKRGRQRHAQDSHSATVSLAARSDHPPPPTMTSGRSARADQLTHARERARRRGRAPCAAVGHQPRRERRRLESARPRAATARPARAGPRSRRGRRG